MARAPTNRRKCNVDTPHGAQDEEPRDVDVNRDTEVQVRVGLVLHGEAAADLRLFVASASTTMSSSEAPLP